MQIWLARIAPVLFVWLWSTGFIGAKLGLPYADPGVFLLVRFLITAALLAVVVSFFVGPWPRDPRFYAHQAVIGLLMHCCYLGGVFVKDELVPELVGATPMRDSVQSTALYYFQLYFALYSFTTAKPRAVGLACAFLACKVHDMQKRMRDVLAAYGKINDAVGDEAPSVQ